jgi:diguanylate cyclase (GGDEF)-like protein
VLAVGVLACAATLPSGAGTREWASIALRFAVAGAAVAVVAVRPRAQHLVWLAAGLVVTVLADLVYSLVVTSDSTTSVADVLYLAYYPSMVVGTVALVRRRRLPGLREAVLDGCAMGLAALLLAWQFLVIDAGLVSGPMLDRVVNAAYPVSDALLAGLVAILVFAPGRRTRAAKLLGAHVLLTLVADVVYAIVTDNGPTARYFTAPLFTVSYAILLVAMAHPSMAVVEDEPLTLPMRREALYPLRLSMLAMALVAAPAVAVVEERRGGGLSVTVLMAVAGLVCALVLVRMHGLLRKLREAEATLAFRASHDMLTELPNREALLEHLEAVLEDGRVAPTVFFVDLDRFKLVNEHLGHRAGDDLLLEATRRLRVVTREGGLLARHGGDEFVVLLADDPHPERVVRLAERLISVLSAPYSVQGSDVFVSASVGIAQAEPTSDADGLLHDADTAMHAAKTAGGTRWRRYDSGMRARVAERVQTETALRRALDADELVVVYQPQVSLPGRELTGFEALQRWHRPGVGVVSPTQFIPIAEETGLIVEIGHWVLERACRQIAIWNGRALDRAPLNVSVNVSGLQLARPEFVGSVQHLVRAVGIDPSWLTIEITETTLVHEPEVVQGRLEQLQELGVRIAVDDFGTGYSSLASLRRFPLDEVKIDRSFVSELGTLAPERTIASAVIALSRALGYEVVAEGVEHEHQVDVLSGLGCDGAQGYLFAHPLSVAEADAAIGWASRPSAFGPDVLTAS